MSICYKKCKYGKLYTMHKNNKGYRMHNPDASFKKLLFATGSALSSPRHWAPSAGYHHQGIITQLPSSPGSTLKRDA